MATKKQLLGDYGEKSVIKNCSCPKCKREKSLKQLPKNFVCADVICDFCGYLAQVKTKSVSDINSIPKQILGAAWSVQKERMDSSIYFPLFLVLKNPKGKISINYLSADLQNPTIFVPRKPLSSTARRAGWQGFLYKLDEDTRNAFVRLI
jgi:type II restriction enzyme